jgi:hypothetical protein
MLFRVLMASIIFTIALLWSVWLIINKLGRYHAYLILKSFLNACLLSWQTTPFYYIKLSRMLYSFP